MTGLLQDRVAIVVGIGPGIGTDTARAFAREGARVVLGARTEERLGDVAREVEALGGSAEWRATDVTDEGQCSALAQAALDRFGRIDVLVNNAFVQPPIETIEDNTLETWRQAFEVNLFGAVAMTKAVLPAMKEQRAGSVVFVASMSARRIQVGFGPYAASKNALLSTARTLAKELGPDGIRVNSVLPGYVWGPSLKWWFKQLAKEQGRTREEVYDEVAAETSLRRLPTPAEVADAIVFLASDLARGITGQTLDVNAGHWFD
ncbi:MAG TPA: SDR family oxidoreductase [Actinomycetota bacterium]|nr:SDR family oxidoreductase [Actinomycetota bacterium]